MGGTEKERTRIHLLKHRQFCISGQSNRSGWPFGHTEIHRKITEGSF